jgi:hypothetical protein
MESPNAAVSLVVVVAARVHGRRGFGIRHKMSVTSPETF